jgi:hypothetical protein
MEPRSLQANYRHNARVNPSAEQNLWSSAPGFRTLVKTSGALATLSAASFLALPQLHPALEIARLEAPPASQFIAPARSPPATSDAAPVTPDPATCAINVPREGQKLIGKARGLVSEAEVRRSEAATEQRVHGSMSAEYVGMKNELVTVEWTDKTIPMGTWYAVIPDGFVVNPGDVVEIINRHRDPGKPCSYIPRALSRVVTAGG